MSQAKSPVAEKRQVLFAQIASRPGGAKAALLAPAVRGRAERNLKQMTPEALAEIRRTIEAMKALADGRGPVARIWSGAHDLRGLAGAFGLQEVGVIAGAVRSYGEDTPADFQPDWTFVQTLMAMLLRAFQHPGEMPVEVVAVACEEAVAAQLQREGRAVG